MLMTANAKEGTMREDGEDMMGSANDNATIFDQVEQHLAETEAPFDVQAGLSRLRRPMAELPESGAPRQGRSVMAYRTQNGRTEFGFSIEFLPDVGWRIYIVFLSSTEDAIESRRLPRSATDRNGRRYIAWSTKIDILGEARTIAELWAEMTQRYLSIQEPRRATAPGSDRLDRAGPGDSNSKRPGAGGRDVPDLAG
jgi:hypothetical protein